MTDETEDSFIWTFNKFLEITNNKAPQVLLTDDDKAIANAYTQTFKLRDTKHRLCQWHLLKNVMKNLIGKLGNNWQSFIKDFYSCLEEIDLSNFHDLWCTLKKNYPNATSYLQQMEKTVDKWAICYINNIFLADMTTTQRGESMNHLMKGYMDATTSLTSFIRAFESALDSCKECAELEVY